MAVSSRLVRFVVAAILVASVIGVAFALRFGRTHDPVIAQPMDTPSALPAPIASAQPVPQLQGHIVDASGNAVNGATVRVLASAHTIAETVTDSAGRFAFDRLASGSVRVEADHDPEGAVDSAAITISSTPTDLTLVLAPASIEGVVVDGEKGEPIANASLSFEDVSFTTPTATTDEKGAFHFAAVPFEARTIVAVANGFRASRVAIGSREEALPAPLRIILRSAPPIEGDVIDAENKPIRAHVVACEGKPFEVQLDSKDDGTFELPPSSVGCDAFAVHDDMAASDAIPITEGRHLTLRLGAAGSISGFAVDEQGRSIDAFSVGVESFIPARGVVGRPGNTTNFTNGSFHLDRLVPGTYVLTASTAGRPPARSDHIVVKSGAVTDNVKIVILKGGIVEGRVLDEQHQPLADVELRFDSISAVSKGDAFAKTDASGHYRLESAPAGPLTVGAQKEGYKHKLVSVAPVLSGNTTIKDITLTKGTGFELSGIGANVGPAGNGIAFAGILPGDPAELAGLRPGDRIVRIDGEEIAGFSIEDAIQRLRGDPGTVVGITVERDGATMELTITRATVTH
jgi:protocatechuate 3,4-dioxygenase beta subunit